jgi:hypothetical protein
LTVEAGGGAAGGPTELDDEATALKVLLNEATMGSSTLSTGHTDSGSDS